MNREEAIKRVERVKGLYAYESDYEALDMAIEALKTADNPIFCPRCGRTFSEMEGRQRDIDPWTVAQKVFGSTLTYREAVDYMHELEKQEKEYEKRRGVRNT